MAGSVCQYCSMSLPERSARLPAETNVENPRPRSVAAESNAMPRAPDWLKNPTRPWPGRSGASVALSRTCGSVFATPSAFGPTTRIPCARASSASRRRAPTPSVPAPSAPGAAYPELRTTSARTPLARQESITSPVPAAGTATTARSTSSGMSVTDAYARTPRTDRASGLTG